MDRGARQPDVRGASREQVLRRLPWLRSSTIVVGDLYERSFVVEPGTDGPFFYGASVRGIDFAGMDLAQFHATGSVFERCEFSNARLKDNVSMSQWPQTVYRDCVFDRADMVGIRRGLAFQLGYARFERCSFRHTRISSWRSRDAEFIDCVFEGRIKSSSFFGCGSAGASDPVRMTADGFELPRGRVNEFRGNDFSRADLVGCRFVDIDLDANRWPAHDS
jgi:uncharacterized protein YjbI with pentapeptide repeats